MKLKEEREKGESKELIKEIKRKRLSFERKKDKN